MAQGKEGCLSVSKESGTPRLLWTESRVVPIPGADGEIHRVLSPAPKARGV